MASNPGNERNANFIARANDVKRFIQTVAMFALCVTGAVVAGVMGMAGLVAVLAVLSAVPGIAGFLWVIERKNWHSDPTQVPEFLQRLAVTSIALLFALFVAVSVSSMVGARAGVIAHLLVYGAEYAIAVTIRFGRLSRAER